MKPNAGELHLMVRKPFIILSTTVSFTSDLLQKLLLYFILKMQQ